MKVVDAGVYHRVRRTLSDMEVIRSSDDDCGLDERALGGVSAMKRHPVC